MKLDFWRALGVTAATMFGMLVVNGFLYASVQPLELADILSAIAGVLVLMVFSYLYFNKGPVAPSSENGVALGMVVFAYTYATNFLGGAFAQLQGAPDMGLPPVNPVVMIISIATLIVTPALVGWYLNKQK